MNGENLESTLSAINQFINIKNDRQRYADHFNHVTKTIFDKLRETQPFRYLFNGFQLGGSYGDRLKVKLPNEFDLVFHLRFPESYLINVIKDYDCRGNVHLDFTKVLHKIYREKQHKTNLRYLRSWLDENNFLKVTKLQSYIESCFFIVLRDMNFHMLYDGDLVNLGYLKQGPAHTIYVSSNCMEYSVDFVPGILLDESQSVIPEHVGQWEAIPKPPKWNQNREEYNSFRSSFYRQEQKLMKNKFQLKNVLRMMKKFRDSHQNMNKMKSYFIKTLFLWKAHEESDIYWRNPLTKIIIDMFQLMENSFRCGNLPFFWDSHLNMYDFSSSLLNEMLICTASARKTLEAAACGLTLSLKRQVYCIFCDATERSTSIKLESAVHEDLDDTIRRIERLVLERNLDDNIQGIKHIALEKKNESWCNIL